MMTAMRIAFKIIFHLALLCCSAVVWAEDKPDFSLANTYRADAQTLSLADYWMSEKYDGARALWNGAQLISRGGKAYAAPAWFIAGLPTVHLDGELWLRRGEFEKIMSVIRRKTPHDGWRDIRYLVFDLPAHEGTFRRRYAAMLSLRVASDNAYWQVVEQLPIESAEALEKKYAEVLAAGGEGIMLRRIESPHRGGRSNDLLKYKPFDDAEAIVIGHHPGKGKYVGMVGSLRVRTAAGVEFNVGSGLTDAMRKKSAAIGCDDNLSISRIDKKRKAEIPVFLRVRNDKPE